MSATTRDGQVMPALLREAYPAHATKRTARAADVPLETARNWVRGRAEPSLSTLLRMAQRCDEFAAALERRLNDRRNSPSADQVLPMAGRGTATDRGGS